MDILAHALWANLAGEAVSRKRKEKLTKKKRASAMLGSVAPDLVAFLPGVFVSAASGFSILAYAMSRFGEEWLGGSHTTAAATELVGVDPAIPAIVGQVYAFSHSGLLWGVAALLAYLLLRRVPFWLWGWGTHIALDVFTHDADHFPTMLLYPLSEGHINATAWSNPLVFGLTYAALLVCYVATYYPRPTSTK